MGLIVKMSNKIIGVFLILIIAAGILFYLSGSFVGGKIVTSDKFRYDASIETPQLADLFSRYFPIGTPRTEVDRILVSIGGARMAEEQPFDKNTNLSFFLDKKSLQSKLVDLGAAYYVAYQIRNDDKAISFAPPASRVTRAFYDKDDKLVFMYVYNLAVHAI